MSAQPEPASPSQCACTNISLMQLFHELKQKFPVVPDHVVSNTIELYCHDKSACETHLKSEVKASLTHAYHASSSAAARQLNELKVDAPPKCRNQPIIKHDALQGSTVQQIPCKEPQNAQISSSDELSNLSEISSEESNDSTKTVEETLKVDEEENQIKAGPRDNGQINRLKEPLNQSVSLEDRSPVTINLDSCVAKYSAESTSDLESVDEDRHHLRIPEADINLHQQSLPESTNFKLLKSNKIKTNLNEKLEKAKEKKPKVISPQTINPEKPKRPCTLEFIKPNPEIAFKPQTIPEPEPSRAISPAPPRKEQETQASNVQTPTNTPWTEHGYPLNLSVNVNCHMDLLNRQGFPDPWTVDYESPRGYTSVNVTVCTPTSSMQSPVRDRSGAEPAEGSVTVTVSPSTTRPRRRAPAPPMPPPSLPVAPLEPTSAASRAELIARQRARLADMARELKLERGRLSQVSREAAILAAPPPSPMRAQQLRDYVARLREQCNILAERVDRVHAGNRVQTNEFYRNIYTGQQPPSTHPQPSRPAPPAPTEPPSWPCHVCTFRNHPLLNKCEECDMPRIVLGTSRSYSTVDSGVSSLGDRRLSTQLENSLLLGEVVNERHVSRACV